MKIRIGYVSTALNLWNSSPAKNLTFTRWKDMCKQDRNEKLKEITLTNIRNTYRVLSYNIAHEICVYRFSSSIVPLATHPEVNFDYINEFKEQWAELGKLVIKFNLRTSFHPNQFTLFTSEKNNITENAIRDLQYHFNLLKIMGISNGTINIHIGGAYGDKTSALERFGNNIELIPEEIRKVLTFENDDKTYTALETIDVCNKYNFKFAFDFHHHIANPCQVCLDEIIKSQAETWNEFGIPPKIHVSSPKSAKEYRAHSDLVDIDFIMPLIDAAKKLGIDIDFMVEAKFKDIAALKLIDDLSKLRGIKRIGGATLEIK
ncbi:MAG: uvsE [Bacillales bacterium]|jgi:UV DNA damage endonuclease|nr:uvsE [Bacillales bacterium]